MARRSKTPKSPYHLLQAKKDRLDWGEFHFLENMLVFCVCRQLDVPPESGVCFRISREAGEDTICLLFQIDRKADPLIREPTHPRPDYLTLFISSEVCIFTIIEMKGRTETGTERGVEQILRLRSRLRQEFTKHWPAVTQRAVFQGILLCPYDADVPRKQIAKEADDGFVIIPLQYNQKSELFPYISKANALKDIRYEHSKLKAGGRPGLIESLLVHNALQQRIRDAYHRSKLPSDTAPDDRLGVYINYVLSERDEYAVLWSGDGKGEIAVREEGGDFLRRIDEGLRAVGLSRMFKVRRLE